MGAWEAINVDGKTVRAYAAGEAKSGSPGVVVCHAWWGLNEDVQLFADRLSRSGFAVLVPDLYNGVVVATIDEAETASSLPEEEIDAIALAALDDLAGRLGAEARLGAVGFSFGAAWALWIGAKREAVRASVVYYGTLSGPSLSAASIPVLGHFAEDDPYEADEAVTEFENTLRAAGREVTIHRYPGTGHWFAEPSRDAYVPDAAELAYERTVEFLDNRVS